MHSSSFLTLLRGTHRAMGRQTAGVRVLLLLLCVCCPAFAQDKVGIRVANNTVLVPVRINHRDLAFILDTGSELSAIDAAVAQELGLTGTGTLPVLKNYREQGSEVIEVPSLGIGRRIFSHKRVGTLDLTHVSAAVGVHIDGIVGSDILQTALWHLNYSRQELTIGSSEHIERLGRAIELRRDGDEYYVPLKIISVPVELLLDSGTNSTNLSSETWHSVSQVWQPPAIIDGVVRAGLPVPPAFLVCLPSISFGDETLTNQVMRVQRSVTAGAFAEPGFGGILGSDFLRQFEVTLDLAYSRLFLKRDPGFKPDPYRYTTIGIQFAKDPNGEDVVMSVWKGSPAEEAGMKAGDRIKAVNGQPVQDLSLEQLGNQLHGPVGTPVRLIMARDSVSFAVTVRTRQMLCSSNNVHNALRAAQK